MRIDNAAADYYINSSSTCSTALDVFKHKTSGLALLEVVSLQSYHSVHCGNHEGERLLKMMRAIEAASEKWKRKLLNQKVTCFLFSAKTLCLRKNRVKGLFIN